MFTTAGGLGESEVGGPAMNLVPRQGGNRLSGTYFTNWANDKFQTSNFTPEIQAAFDQTAREFNQILPDGIPTSFKSVSIVELGFAGNVLREIYRISLEDGSVLNVATGKPMPK